MQKSLRDLQGNMELAGSQLCQLSRCFSLLVELSASQNPMATVYTCTVNHELCAPLRKHYPATTSANEWTDSLTKTCKTLLHRLLHFFVSLPWRVCCKSITTGCSHWQTLSNLTHAMPWGRQSDGFTFGSQSARTCGSGGGYGNVLRTSYSLPDAPMSSSREPVLHGASSRRRVGSPVLSPRSHGS